MKFVTRELLSKWGLEDGDILQSLLVQHGFDLGTLNDHDVLRSIIKELVIPAIVNCVEIQELSTLHNPVRITAVDGAPVDNSRASHPEIDLQPTVIDVPDEVVLEYAARAARLSAR
jgi:hypothetical protein